MKPFYIQPYPISYAFLGSQENIITLMVLRLSALRYLRQGVLFEKLLISFRARSQARENILLPGSYQAALCVSCVCMCTGYVVPGTQGITVVWIRTPPTQAAGAADSNQEDVGFPAVARVRASHSFV